MPSTATNLSRDASLDVGLIEAGESDVAKIVRFHQLCGPENLKLEDAVVREPGPGEVNRACRRLD